MSWGQGRTPRNPRPRKHTGPGHGFFGGRHPEPTGRRPVMMGGRLFGNYIPLRTKQLEKLQADVDALNQYHDASDYHRLLMGHAMKATELQQLRALLSGGVPSPQLRGVMERRVGEVQREIAEWREIMRRARERYLARRSQATWGVRDPVTGLTFV